jgi:hypothetical protein
MKNQKPPNKIYSALLNAIAFALVFYGAAYVLFRAF